MASPIEVGIDRRQEIADGLLRPPRDEMRRRADVERERPREAEDDRDRETGRRGRRVRARAPRREAMGSTSATTASQTGPASPVDRNPMPAPSPNSAPPATARRTASAKPYCAAATPSISPSSGDSWCARSHSPTEPMKRSTVIQRYFAPLSSVAVAASSSSVSARKSAAATRAASCSGIHGDSASPVPAAMRYTSGGLSTYGSPTRRGASASPRSIMSSATPNATASCDLPRIVSDHAEQHPYRAQDRESELLHGAVAARRSRTSARRRPRLRRS